MEAWKDRPKYQINKTQYFVSSASLLPKITNQTEKLRNFSTICA
ncbi:hypothetical protein HCH_04380 [Hahella chejuensis KCTC 2396]|uniref:Uncharacterized protein n=1 Tax=Hahella chejuensis (strain KCTC 2396) TaxID=349521 RepID=Q2SE39_HAHCH|nr:hypothetical protein HCH_04380 [Hahella chejuensis KCTC 2396]